MKFLHTADLHKNPKRYADLELSLDVIEETAERERVDATFLAGDLYDGAEQNSELGLHTPFARRIQRLGNIAPVAIVKGTPTHDIPGSLDIFEELACEFGITILQPGETYFLHEGGINQKPEGAKAILFGLAEPGRSWVAARTVDGKSKTADEINAELRALVAGLLLGYGAKRREYPDLPCVFMYHGQVRGCRLSNGTTLPDGPVSADDLRMVGFDYGALGDIHEPQQIPGLPAYYPGSVYTDWGEYHKAGCNLVEITKAGVTGGGALFDLDAGFNVAVTRIEFPHPQRKKIELTSGLPLAKDYGDRLVWVDLTCTQEEAADLDAEALLADILQGGALPGSRVTINKIPTETVRAGEIVKKATLAEKVALQGENSNTPYAPSVLAKASETEAAVGSLSALAGPERRFRNVSTRLRGSRGFWNKQKKDEVFIPWAEIGEGVIPYVGPNGNGKTTSYDFAKPWAVPVSRPPKTLKAHFRLRDSAIENVYLEEASGTYYRTLINIDGANKSGDAKYYFYRGPSADGPWTPYSDEACTGRQDGFCAAIDEVFGSMTIYMRTAFAAQTPTPDFPDIARATKDEKKALIGELAGKDYAPYRDYATGKAKAGETELITLDATISAAADVDELIERLEAEKTEAEEKARAGEGEAEHAQSAEKTLTAEREALALRVAEADRKAERRRQLEVEIEETSQAIAAIEEEVKGFSLASEGRAAAAEELEKIKALEARRDELRALKAKHDEAERDTAQTYQTTTAELRRQQDQARAAVDSARSRLAAAEKAEEVARARIDTEAEGKLEAARTAFAA
ncbi:MAG: metallophosphoesterase, partial [Elusimicrobia bacterium]|nr:metallophosphoesterase [Elusimicrobiota bacterium]